jgi:hypothetical protein
MQVIWRDGMTKGDNAPMTVKAVETETGSRISADLVVALETVQAPRVPGMETVLSAPSDEGLLEVIEAQMAALDEMAKEVDRLENHQPDEGCLVPEHKGHADLQEWADQFPYLVEELCAALGFARNPVRPTGIPELDIIVSLAR